MAQASLDYDSLILSRLCHSAPVLNRATEIFSKAKAPCTSPGSAHFLGDFRTGLPTFCAFIAAERLDTNEVPLEKALMAACLNRDEFERGVRTVEKAAGLSLTTLTAHTPLSSTLIEKQSLSFYRPITQTPNLSSPSLLPPGENGYLYQILEPICSPSTQFEKCQSASARKTKRKRTEEDSPGEAAGISGSSQHLDKTDGMLQTCSDPCSYCTFFSARSRTREGDKGIARRE
ncbi:hypothetical protein CPB85DRAFT_1327347 [Mucidula mucida]|nr:hypothetical protein CPB85DRAFT_1327347 [Mucidula mucida]